MKCPKCGKHHYRRLKDDLCLECSPVEYVKSPDTCLCEFVKCERITAGFCNVHKKNIHGNEPHNVSINRDKK